MVPVPVPVIMPVVKPAVAILVLLLLQVPPVPSLRDVVRPLQRNVEPVMLPGNGLTVIVFITEQPVVVIVYEIRLVPVATPETIPENEPTVAALELELLHEPPPPSVNATVAPTHTDDAPVIAAGKAFTVNTVVALHPELRV